jgi:SAM-dependent methyltransferase
MDTFRTKLRIKLKKMILIGVLLANIFTNFLPRKLKSKLILLMLLLEGHSINPRKDLIELLLIKDELEKLINNRALAFGNGEHPKHYLTKYHDFFIENISDGESVLDIGCGYGAVARNIAKQRPNSIIIGIDNNESRLRQAVESENPKNLTFIYGDATRNVQNKNWDVVVLSNVLEHIDNRVEFLNSIRDATKAKKFLIRVPCFERNWQVPLREKLGINYFTDDDHKIEHKLNEFHLEISNAKLEAVSIITNWGEIWAVCTRVNK